MRRLRRWAARAVHPGHDGDRSAILGYARELLERKPDVVLISAYTMYADTCAGIAALCKVRGIPVLVGGGYFVAPEVVERWLALDGVTAVYGGEPERDLPALLDDLAARRDVAHYAGVSVPGRQPASAAPPLADLDQLPFPDYADFPWHLYPNRIVPIMTGRGCGWGRCTFCADVVTSAGRTFRTRSLQNVLEEIRWQRERHGAQLFVFLDLKLNSDLRLWRGLLEALPEVAPGAAWTASVHVDTRTDHGLRTEDLTQARKAGLARVTTGLETASAALQRRMSKGISTERTAAFLRDSTEAGISARLTMIVGHPGEEPRDVDATARFLGENEPWVERVMLNRFTLMLGAEAERRARTEALAPGFARGAVDPSTAVVEHQNAVLARRDHRAAVYRLMKVVHRINRKRLAPRAREFEGVM